MGAYLADRHRATAGPAPTPPRTTAMRPRLIAADGRARKGMARPPATRRHRHLMTTARDARF
jgi:hypothetical protein